MAKSKKNEEFEEFEEFDDYDQDDFEKEEEETKGDIGKESEPAEVMEEEEAQKEENTEDSQGAAPFGGETESEQGSYKEDVVGDKSKKAKWYVVHTYSGHENKVKVNIEKIVENRGMQDLVLSIIVPTEDVVEMKNGQRKVKTRKMFPGYVLVKMIVTNESWYLVRNTQGVTGFVGHGSEPIPLTNEEVRRMGIEKVYIQLDIEPGDSVKVINGPFESFMGVVEEVNMDKQTLKVKISMFGRDTPVELEFGQVDKI